MPQTWWSVDPGDVHVGLAEWHGTGCVRASETTPVQIEDRLYGMLLNDFPIDRVVIERFALRGELMYQQQGSEFLTSQLIGSLRFICRSFGVPVTIQTAQQHKVVLKRDPWRTWPQRRWVSYGHGPHAKSAELHGYFFIESVLRQQGQAALQEWKESLS